MSYLDSQKREWDTSTSCASDSSFISRIEIRVLKRADLQSLEWEGEYTRFRRLYSQIYRNARKGKAVMWVADMEDRGIIGQVFVQLISANKDVADGEVHAYIYAFRVRPEFRGFGLGTRMLLTAEEDLKQRGFRWVSLNVGRNNLDARRFYERHGYRVIAAEPGRWTYLDEHGRRCQVNEPAWRMKKLLTQ